MKGSIENNHFRIVLTNRLTVASSLLNASLLPSINSGTNSSCRVTPRSRDGGGASVVEPRLVVVSTAAVVVDPAVVVAPVNVVSAVVSRNKHVDQRKKKLKDVPVHFHTQNNWSNSKDGKSTGIVDRPEVTVKQHV